MHAPFANQSTYIGRTSLPSFILPFICVSTNQSTRTYLHLLRTSHKQVWKLLNDCLPLWQRDRPPQEPGNSSHIQQEPSPPAPTSRDAPAPKLSSNSRAKTSALECTPVVSSQPLSTRNALLLANYAASDRAGYQVRHDWKNAGVEALL